MGSASPWRAWSISSVVMLGPNEVSLVTSLGSAAETRGGGLGGSRDMRELRGGR